MARLASVAAVIAVASRRGRRGHRAGGRPPRSCVGCTSVDGPVDQFNQTVVVQAPAGVTEADVQWCCRRCWTGMPCCGCGSKTTVPVSWSLTVPEAGSVDAARCVQTVDVLSEEAVAAARSRLNPAAGAMLSALWAPGTGQLVLMIHHLAVDGVSWRILLEDLNIAWAQHRSGQPVALPARRHVVRPVGGAARRACAHAPDGRGAGRGLAAGGGDPGGAARGATGGRHLRRCRVVVGLTGCRDDAAAAG